MTGRADLNPYARELRAQIGVGSDKTPVVETAASVVRDIVNVDDVVARPRGRLYAIMPATPVAGANFSYIHKASAAAIVHSIDLLLLTSATAANRSVAVTLVQGGIVIASTMRDITIAQIASTTRAWRFRDNWALPWIEYTSDIVGPLPPMVITEGAQMLSSVLNIQTVDQIFGIVLTLEDC